MERDLRPLVRPVSKGRFLNVTVCVFKLRNFETSHGGSATETSTWVDFISLLRLSFPFIYIIRCTPQLRCTLFAYIFQGWIPWICISWDYYGRSVCVYSAGVGRLSLLILIKGQCEGLTVGISAEEILPRFFYFHKIHTNHIAEQGVSGP